jgi:hypothetical protein
MTEWNEIIRNLENTIKQQEQLEFIFLGFGEFAVVGTGGNSTLPNFDRITTDLEDAYKGIITTTFLKRKISFILG